MPVLLPVFVFFTRFSAEVQETYTLIAHLKTNKHIYVVVFDVLHSHLIYPLNVCGNVDVILNISK